MTMVVSGGTVSVEDCVKHAGYPDPQFAPTRKIRVELNFDVPEGFEAQVTLDAVAELANKKVRELLGKEKVPSGATAKSEVKPETVAPSLPSNSGQTTTEKPKRGPGRPKTDKDKLAEAAGVQKPEPVDDGILEESDTPIADALKAASETVDEGIDDLLGEEPAKEISDADLNSAVQDWMGKHKPEDAPRVRKLATDRGGPPLSRIPQDKRPEFLKALAELK
jgi:hypothetical protein